MREIPLCRFKVSIYNTPEEYQNIFERNMQVFLDIAADVPFFKNKDNVDTFKTMINVWFNSMIKLSFNDNIQDAEYYEEYYATFNIKANIINTIITISR